MIWWAEFWLQTTTIIFMALLIVWYVLVLIIFCFLQSLDSDFVLIIYFQYLFGFILSFIFYIIKKTFIKVYNSLLYKVFK